MIYGYDPMFRIMLYERDGSPTFVFDLVDAHQTISRSPGRLPAAREASSKGRPERLAQSQDNEVRCGREPGALGALRHALQELRHHKCGPGGRSAPRRPASLRPGMAVEAGAGHARSRFPKRRRLPVASLFGLLVLPVYGAVSLEFGNLLSASVSLIGRGESMWFHTKIEATRQFVLKVRTWDKAEGRISRRH